MNYDHLVLLYIQAYTKQAEAFCRVVSCLLEARLNPITTCGNSLVLLDYINS